MKLRLKSAKGIKAGPLLDWSGLDEIEIDFTGKQGLISIAGENGAGKSTAIECAHHYPQLVSRDGALWQHFLGREAEKEFISTFMGHEYRSLIKMDAEQGKQEGYLWIDGKPSVNGKITAYKEKVNEIFGQPFTYFRSQFCPQKSKKTREMQIENMTANVFRKLLREFLNLQKYAVWEDTAKQAGNIFQGKVAGLDQRIAGLQETTGKKPEADLACSEAGFKAEMLRDNLTALRHALDDKRSTVDVLKTTIQQNAFAIQRKADLQEQLDRLEMEMAKEKKETEGEIGALTANYREIKYAIGKQTDILEDREMIETAAENVRELEAGLPGLVSMLEEMSADVPVNQKRCHDLETQLAQLRQQVKDLENDPENIRMGKLIEEAERAVRDKEREINTLDGNRELVALESQMEHNRIMSKALEAKDPECKSTSCSFIVGALNAADEMIPLGKRRSEILSEINGKRQELNAGIETIKSEAAKVLKDKAARLAIIAGETEVLHEQNKKVMRDLCNTQQVIAGATELLASYRRDLTNRRAELARQKALADRLPEMRVAAERKADLEKQLEEVTRVGSEKKQAWEVKENAIKIEMISLRDKIEAIVIDFQAETELKSILTEITEISAIRIPAVEKEIQAVRDQIATLQAELARIEQAEKELAQVKNQRDLLTRNMTSWRYLQLGCGKTGLQNLRIDGAAPRIVYNANKLLSQAYGALYSIRLETINEAGKEDLQIKVIMENGQEVCLDDLSGGQKQWLIQSLWLAMSLLNQEKSGRKYDYFCSDESDGMLDQDNADKYTALYRPFMAQADLNRFIFISHRPSCRDAADHQLCFEHGKNPFWV